MADRATVPLGGAGGPRVEVPEGPLPEGEEWVAEVVPLSVAMGLRLPLPPPGPLPEVQWAVQDRSTTWDRPRRG